MNKLTRIGTGVVIGVFALAGAGRAQGTAVVPEQETVIAVGTSSMNTPKRL